MSSRVYHFEIPMDDPDRAVTFYSKMFGWKIQKWDGPNEYWLVDTGEEGPGINGGMIRRDGPFTTVINTVGVDDLDVALKRLQNCGGTIVADKMTIPGVGYLAYAKDTEGNVFGMMQAI